MGVVLVTAQVNKSDVEPLTPNSQHVLSTKTYPTARLARTIPLEIIGLSAEQIVYQSFLLNNPSNFNGLENERQAG